MKTRLKTIKKRNDFYSLVFQSLNLLIQGNESELLIFNIWGAPGSGKTYVLNEIKNKAKDMERVKVFGPIDVSEHNHKLLDDTLSEVNNAGMHYTKLILLDNLKSVINTGQEDAFIYDVEDRLVSPVISNGNTIVVITSLHEIKQWRSMEVRIRHKTILIPSLDTEIFKASIKTANLNYATTYKKTLGHPKLLDWLVKSPDLVDEEIDKKAINFFLNGLEPETKKIAQVMSLSNSFSVPAYQKALEVMGLRVENSYFNDLKKIKEMGSIGLVIYESNNGMYRFSDPILREVLARAFRHEFPDLAAKVYHELAELSIYEAKFANSLPSHLLNVIYQQLWNSKLNGFSYSQWLDEWFSNNNDVWKDTNWKEVDRVVAKNPSSKYILNEIKKLAGPEIYKKIILKIRPNRRIKK